MRTIWERFQNWLFRIENEVMLPFISVGVFVIAAFGMISCYNGYSMQMEYERELARTVCQNVNIDILYAKNRMTQEEMAEKYRKFGANGLRILDMDGHVIAGPKECMENQKIIYTIEGGNSYEWKLEYVLDMDAFHEEFLEKQTYVIVGAVSCLLIVVQVSVFLAWSLTKPIRSMSATCEAIDNNKKDYRRYRFDAVVRRDEIGQLARTLETLLRNLDNYTKMEYTSRMSATLLHEIKNPLTGIRSGVQVLKGRVEKENEKFLCDSMIHEIDRVTELIHDLFTLSVRKENHMTEFLLAPYLKEIETLYQKGLTQQNIEFLVECEPELQIFADGNELRQMLHNVMTNSMKAMVEGRKGKIRLLARGEADKVILSLEDNGCGMNESELEQAREPFFTKSINGVGIGLAIVSRLTEKNLGTMEMDSVPMEGTTVRFTFLRESNV